MSTTYWFVFLIVGIVIAAWAGFDSGYKVGFDDGVDAAVRRRRTIHD